MLNEKGKYRFVSAESLKRISVSGDVFPLRAQKRIFKAEDYAFLAEAEEERTHTGKTVEIKWPIKTPNHPRVDVSQFVDKGKLARESLGGEDVGDSTAVRRSIDEKVSKLRVYDAVAGLKTIRPWLAGHGMMDSMMREFANVERCVVKVEKAPDSQVSNISASVDIVGIQFIVETTDKTYVRHAGGRYGEYSYSKYEDDNGAREFALVADYAKMTVRIGNRLTTGRIVGIKGVIEIEGYGSGGSGRRYAVVDFVKDGVESRDLLKAIDSLDDEFARASAELDEKYQPQFAKIEETHAANVASIDAERDGALSELVDEINSEFNADERKLASAFIAKCRPLALDWNMADSLEEKSRIDGRIADAARSHRDEMKALEASRDGKLEEAGKSVDERFKERYQAEETRYGAEKDAKTAEKMNEWKSLSDNHEASVDAVHSSHANYRMAMLEELAVIRNEDHVGADYDSIEYAQADVQYELGVLDIEDLDASHREKWSVDLSPYLTYGEKFKGHGSSIHYSTNFDLIYAFVEYSYDTLTGAKFPDYEALDASAAGNSEAK